MTFIKKKNLQEGEELLYVPRLHWMFTIRHMVMSLPFFLFLLIIWGITDSYADASGSILGLASALVIKIAIRNAFLAVLIAIMLVFVWRIFQYISYEYGVTNKRLLMKKGVIRLSIAEIPTDRIESIYCTQGLLGRIFRYGTISISGIGGTMPVFYMVSRPYALRRKIVKIIEKNKAITLVHGELPKPEPVAKPEPKVEVEPIYRYGTFVRVLPEDK
jgi:uncharacterized membrane protein YdbT with pleckstrin-like domain